MYGMAQEWEPSACLGERKMAALRRKQAPQALSTDLRDTFVAWACTDCTRPITVNTARWVLPPLSRP
jgi:hypothetical protein